MQKIKLILILVVLLFLSISVMGAKDEDIQQKEEGQQAKKEYLTQTQSIKLVQRAKKNGIEIEKDRYQIYNFKLNNFTNFQIKQQETNMIKLTFDVYWNQKNVYMQAAVLKAEEITLNVKEKGGKVIIKEQFYTTNGIKFKAEGGKIYQVQLRQKKNAKRAKFIIMHMTEIIYIKKAVRKGKMQKIQAKMQTANRKLENSFHTSSVGNMLENSITKQVLNKSTLYSYFQIIQTFFILIFSFFLVKFIKKLLQNDIIV